MNEFNAAVHEAVDAWLYDGGNVLEKSFKSYVEEHCDSTDDIYDNIQSFLDDYKDEFVDILTEHLVSYVDNHTKMSLKFTDSDK